jgi:hypothetical protein
MRIISRILLLNSLNEELATFDAFNFLDIVLIIAFRVKADQLGGRWTGCLGLSY